MSYEGTTRKDLLPSELTSVKRLRESGGRLPDGSGFFTATVKTKKESAEGGPGSGPRKHGGDESPQEKKRIDRAVSKRKQEQVGRMKSAPVENSTPNKVHTAYKNWQKGESQGRYSGMDAKQIANSLGNRHGLSREEKSKLYKRIING